MVGEEAEARGAPRRAGEFWLPKPFTIQGRRSLRPPAICLAVALAGGPSLLLLATTPAQALPELTVDHREIGLLIRALSYDDALRARAGAEVNVMVLVQGDEPTADRAARAMSEAFGDSPFARRLGLKIVAAPARYSSGDQLAAALGAGGTDVVYIGRGLEPQLPEILEVTRGKKVLSLAGQREYIGKGASLGVFPVDGRPTIFVNLGASRREGAAFAMELLRVAKVTR
jgi:hypothetical protein